MRLAYFLLLPLLPLFSQDPDVKAYVPHLTPLNRKQPVLPDAARAQGIDGMVRVLVTIDQQGLVINAEALTGPAILRQPALDTVGQWKFRPVIREGRAVESFTDENVVFFIPGKRSPPAYNAAEVTSATHAFLIFSASFPVPRSKSSAIWSKTASA
jgi:TonB family protein